MKRKIILFLSAALLFSAFSFFAVNANNGSCGATAAWNFDSDLGTLYISGNGAMTDYEKETDVPWHHLRDDIVYISVSEGITRIGNNAFRHLENLLSVNLPSTLETIGSKAFAYCYTLRDIKIPSTVKAIGESAFYYCKNIADVTLPSAVTEIKKDTFFGCQSLVSLKMGDNVKTVGEGAFYFCIKLSNLKLSNTIEKIEKNAFNYCEALKVFTCVMSDDDWASVDVASGNECLTSARRYSGESIIGDTDGDGTLGANDAIYLLYNIFFGNENYPIEQNRDFNKDNAITADDAIYLLYHVFFGSQQYPL